MSNVSQSSGHPIHGFSFHALGGVGHLRIADTTEAVAREAVVAVVKWLREAEARYSRFQPDSLVSRLNRGEVVKADDGLLALLDAAENANRHTNGRLNVTAFPVWRLWHDPHRVAWPSDAEIAAVMESCGCNRASTQRAAEKSSFGRFPFLSANSTGLRLPRPGMALDFGGMGKEWCVDQIVAHLERRGLRHFLVELSGDVAARGCQSAEHEGWWVLLPGCARACLLQDAALATSGHGARFRLLDGKRISHLIDARTGRPASGQVRSVTVPAPTCLEAGIAASDAALADDVGTAFARLRGFPGLVRKADDAFMMDNAFSERTAEVSSPIQTPAPEFCV